MNGGLMLCVAGWAGGMLGALLGGLFVRRRLGAFLVREVPLQLHAAMAPLLQSHLDRMQSHAAPKAMAPAIAPSWVEAILQAATAAAVHAERAEQGVRDAMTSALRDVSARPPERSLTPLPQPEPVYDEPESVLELSDDEIDALPPELPAPDKPRKRILPTSGKPIFRNL